MKAEDIVTTIDTLETLYATPDPNSIIKVSSKMTPEYRAWINASKFCVLSTVGPDGTDGSPRGDDGEVVTELDENTLAMPDWRGNNRMDSLRNIVADGRVSLLFLIPVQNNTIRVNGRAVLSVSPYLIDRFEKKGLRPKSVIVITISEIYSQCARALLRSGLWQGAEDVDLPTMGDILNAQTQGAVDGKTYDERWQSRAKQTMWADPT